MISRSWKWRLSLSLFLVPLGPLITPVLASPNGLNQIPIAKVYGDGGIALEAAQSNLCGASTTVFSTQHGLFNLYELGLDYQAAPTDQQALLANAKVLVFHRPGNLPDMSPGIENVATGQRAVPYFVAITQPRSTGMSLGIIRPALNGYEGMAGVPYNISSTTQIVGDTIRGWSNYTTLGIISNITPSIQVNLAYAQY